MSVEGTNMQIARQMPEKHHDISSPSVASQVVGKRPNFSAFSEDSRMWRSPFSNRPLK